MTRIELEIHDNVISTLNKIRNINDEGVELVIPENAILFDNVLNLKLVNEMAENYGVSVQFSTIDPRGSAMIELMEEKGGITTEEALVENTSYEAPMINIKHSPTSGSAKGFSVPKLPVVSFGWLGGLKSNGLFVAAGVITAFVSLCVLAGLNLPTAYATITAATEPLTRSITIKVDSRKSTDAEEKILKGIPLEIQIEGTMEIDTTGTKQTGKKATGTVTLSNTKESEVELKKGSQLTYKDKDKKEWKFFTMDSVKIPAGSKEAIDPAATPVQYKIVAGTTTVKVEAETFGEAYNIDEKKSLSVKGYDSKDVSAVSKTEFTGGKTETIKIVADVDRQTLSEKLGEQNTKDAADQLQNKTGSSQRLITGSLSTKVVQEKFSFNVGDTADKISLTQTVSAQGLVYSVSDLNGLVDKLIDTLIPEDFELAKKAREIKVEILGNSSSSVVNSTEADIQVTVKTFVQPKLSAETIKTSIKGKSVDEAQKILADVKNTKSFELKITPAVPFFKKVPNNLARINVTIKID